MIPQEILKQVRRIEITTGKIVNEVMAGQYRSVFKGRGMEFEETREYQPGDDIRTIDWNVTARAGQPYVKVFREERELTVIFLLDMSASGIFGTRNMLKNEVSAMISGILAFSAIRNNDRVGAIIFTDKIEKFIPPRKGRTHVLRLIREILYFKPSSKGTDIKNALEYFSKVIRRHSVCFLISDFMDQNYLKQLNVIGKKHDITGILIIDKLEEELPDVGLISLKDTEKDLFTVVDTSSEIVREYFKKRTKERIKNIVEQCKSINIDVIVIKNYESYTEPLIKYFRKRARHI